MLKHSNQCARSRGGRLVPRSCCFILVYAVNATEINLHVSRSLLVYYSCGDCDLWSDLISFFCSASSASYVPIYLNQQALIHHELGHWWALQYSSNSSFSCHRLVYGSIYGGCWASFARPATGWRTALVGWLCCRPRPCIIDWTSLNSLHKLTCNY